MYKTQDFYLSAVLRALGYEMFVGQKVAGKVTFTFNGEGINDRIDSYWNNTLELPARQLIDAIKELKTRIYNL